MIVRNNALPKGQKWHFECDHWPTPAPFGVHLNTLTLMPSLGPETVLVLREERKFMSGLREHGLFTVNIKSGAVRTSAGPVIFMVWWFSPIVNGAPYAAYELLLPLAPEPGISQVLEKGSRQTHLHLVILDEAHEIFDVVEFKNVYGLGGLLNAARELGAQIKDYDFDRAKQAFNREYSLDDLMALQ
jgi:hypothetical protein